MDRPVPNSQVARSHSFDLIRDSMPQSSELPLAEVLDSNQWEDIFVAHHKRCHPSKRERCHPQIAYVKGSGQQAPNKVPSIQ